ncbi:hypothetical protein [uncultured Marinococcus sp.]|nr:hypothetical protein [uncultured Marinococcus sp.]
MKNSSRKIRDRIPSMPLKEIGKRTMNVLIAGIQEPGSVPIWVGFWP